MPNWLNNTIYVIVIIVSMGCITHGFEWKTKKQVAEN